MSSKFFGCCFRTISFRVHQINLIILRSGDDLSVTFRVFGHPNFCSENAGALFCWRISPSFMFGKGFSSNDFNVIIGIEVSCDFRETFPAIICNQGTFHELFLAHFVVFQKCFSFKPTLRGRRIYTLQFGNFLGVVFFWKKK